jgi:hypothetical protein
LGKIDPNQSCRRALEMRQKRRHAALILRRLHGHRRQRALLRPPLHRCGLQMGQEPPRQRRVIRLLVLSN